MIDGVEVSELQPRADERGYLMELLRSDSHLFSGWQYAQSYISLNYPSVIRAWHYHRKQTDIWAVVSGMVKAVMWDPREESRTHGQLQELFLGDQAPRLLKIPVGVIHGYKTIGTIPSLLINFSNQLYNSEQPDEYRLPHNTAEIPYDWDIKIK